MNKKNKNNYEFSSEANYCPKCRKEMATGDVLFELGEDPMVNRDEYKKIEPNVSDSAKRHHPDYRNLSPDDVEFSEESQDISYASTLNEVKKDVKFNSAINYENNEGMNPNHLYPKK